MVNETGPTNARHLRSIAANAMSVTMYMGLNSPAEESTSRGDERGNDESNNNNQNKNDGNKETKEEDEGEFVDVDTSEKNT